MTDGSPSHVTIHPSTLYVGTPAMLIGSRNADGTDNLAPASSYWALGSMLVIGLEDGGKTIENVVALGELTVNFPQPELWRSIEAIGEATGKDPVPASKTPRYRHIADKFTAAGLTPQPSELVAPARVAECALQFEAIVRRITPGLEDYSIVEAEVIRVHAVPEIVLPGTEVVDPRAWRPTIYSFRHYFGLGEEHGHRPSSDVAGASAIKKDMNPI